MTTYKKYSVFLFEVAGYQFETSGYFDFDHVKRITVREHAPSGHMDTHMSGSLYHDGKSWGWDDGEDHMFSYYGYERLPDSIVRHLNENPPPRHVDDSNLITMKMLPWTCGICGSKAVQNLCAHEDSKSIVGTCSICGTVWVS